MVAAQVAAISLRYVGLLRCRGDVAAMSLRNRRTYLPIEVDKTSQTPLRARTCKRNAAV